ncbi:hypothetical protein [Nocardioides sp. AE5]|uniref:hypothetical protein n=1 Tax=Nocardioides sp. AE5 TaxID=2962573 RepID=UPI00288248BC|nr:hypothetical protein [Nocardioides sp. AE5]MDT0202889.1 hypothetical protein [Nocardioides sp. AE5]
MDELLALHDSPVFLRGEALDHGYTDKELRSGLRAGHLHRIRQGTYTLGAVWANADAFERHRLKAAGVLLTHPGTVMLSHTSAAVEHGLRLWNPNLAKVHVTRLDGSPGRSSKDIVYHQGAWTPDDVHQKEDRLLVGPLRAGLETAALHSVEQGVCILDSVLDMGHASLDELHGLGSRMLAMPHTRRLQLACRLTRVGAESVGESRLRMLCWQQGLPEPVLQFEVRDHQGILIARTDCAWPELGVLGEFDGRVKYGRLLRPGQEPGDAVFLEKRREDHVREVTGMRMVRVIWDDFDRPRLTAARFRSQFNGMPAA